MCFVFSLISPERSPLKNAKAALVALTSVAVIVVESDALGVGIARA